jgi:hypothetical protein
MWSAVLAFLNSLLSALNTWQAGRQRDADRQAGRDATTAQSLQGVLDATIVAKDIESRVLELSDAELDRLLLKPADRDK